MESLCLYIFGVLFTLFTNCQSTPQKSKNPLPYFLRESDEFSNHKSSPAHDSQSHLVSFLVNNAQEIFRDVDEVTEFIKSDSSLDIFKITPSMKVSEDRTEETEPTEDIDKDYLNITISYNLGPFGQVSPGYEIKQAHKKSHALLLSENTVRKSEQKLNHNHTIPKISALVSEETTIKELDLALPGHERSCIFCDNVRFEDCVDPQNKLIPSAICRREGDECYSVHTPFGVIDRGCYNVQRNLTTYVCSCNLCNYLPITDMPQIFTNKREWAHNVVELSRARNLRNSVAKDMACLKCEVNNTAQNQGTIIYNSNCLNGNVGSVPTEICDSKEVCAIKVIKSEGYVWRGCVKTPLYNYFWNICDSDLCNYDTLISIYDYI